MLERLKSLFRARPAEVEYQPAPDQGPAVAPAAPPTGQVPPVAPLEDPAADARTDADNRP